MIGNQKTTVRTLTNKKGATTAVTEECFFFDGKSYPYTLTRKNIKRLYLRVQVDGSLTVSAPTATARSAIEQFIKNEIPFIEKARTKAENAPPRQNFEPVTGATIPFLGIPHRLTIEVGRRVGVLVKDGEIFLTVKNPDNRAECIRVLKAWADREAKERLTALSRSAYQIFFPYPREFPSLIFREMRSRWGICRPTRNTVTLSLALIFQPQQFCEYVVCHEFAHFKHPDHSADFWSWLAAHMPSPKERKKQFVPYFTLK